MSIPVALFTYAMLVALVSLIMTYYFKVIRPHDESKFYNRREEDHISRH